MKNRMVKEKKVQMAILAVGLVVLLLVAACAPAPPAEKKGVVEIGLILALTGPPAAPSQYGFRLIGDYL